MPAEPGDLILLVGTMKGAYLFRSGPDRGEFSMDGPHFPGQAIYALAFDGRGGRQRLLAGTESSHWGAVVRTSDDFGQSWTDPADGNVRFPEGSGGALKRVWQLLPAGADQPDLVYAGVEPAALFRSSDGGDHYELVTGLWDHPHRPHWPPGGGGQCLHTVVLRDDDPDRLLVAISTGGVYRSDDGGKSWQPRNQGIRAVFLPEDQRYPEYGQCVHKVAPAAGQPDRLYLQNHWGLYRSEDGADSWADVANGVPSDFGFPVVAHPRDPNTAYVIPLDSDGFRCTAEARARVYRTRDAGASWQPLTSGLPQEHAWLTVLRDGFTSDRGDPAGLYFGTRSGELYASTDDGDSWRQLAAHLPPIVCVKAALVP